MIQELRYVTLRVDRPLLKLRRGDVGTVVHIYAMGDFYEVEFIDGNGRTRAVTTLHKNKIRTGMVDELSTLMYSEFVATEEEAQQFRAWHVFEQIFSELSLEDAVVQLNFTRKSLAPCMPEWQEIYDRKIRLN